MNGKLLDEYDKILERLENKTWSTKAIIFEVLAIHDKTELERLIALNDEDFKIEMLSFNIK